ncbi:MAG: hypothetical protein ACLT4C_10110 [Butyricicoccus sp.]
MAWLVLIVLILVLSAFRTAEGPIKVLDFTNLAGSFDRSVTQVRTHRQAAPARRTTWQAST